MYVSSFHVFAAPYFREHVDFWVSSLVQLSRSGDTAQFVHHRKGGFPQWLKSKLHWE